PTRFTPGDLITVRQQVPLGLGHAIWCARAIVGDEPFAILLPDELMVGQPGCLAQMVEAYGQVGGNLISVLEVPREEVSSYGVIAPGASNGARSEEHTSELQSRENLVCRLLLEKKKKMVRNMYWVTSVHCGK